MAVRYRNGSLIARSRARTPCEHRNWRPHGVRESCDLRRRVWMLLGCCLGTASALVGCCLGCGFGAAWVLQTCCLGTAAGAAWVLLGCCLGTAWVL
eukprot:9412335-Lingulodinium_polyedra.AAC.1